MGDEGFEPPATCVYSRPPPIVLGFCLPCGHSTISSTGSSQRRVDSGAPIAPEARHARQDRLDETNDSSVTLNPESVWLRRTAWAVA